ncbi:unnamed protein product, partial [Schistocephalus solidus]|uniref:Katanin_con80 domain-containing protein n=1 Tax=Schistocephalus solidus TaxID=70667 RepID=A0A183SUF7_SCHSO
QVEVIILSFPVAITYINNFVDKYSKDVAPFASLICIDILDLLNDRPSRQLCGDLIQTYRIIRSRECALEFADFFELAETEHLRGHLFKLQRKLVHMDIRWNAFSQRVVVAWNQLPDEVVLSETVDKFK